MTCDQNNYWYCRLWYMLWGLGSAELDPAIFKPYCHPRIAANHSPNCYHVHFALSTRSQTAETLMFAGKGFFSSQPSKGIPLPPTSLGWLCDPWTVASRLFCPWDSPGKNTEAACHFLLRGDLPTQGLNPGLLHCNPGLYCRQILYCLSHQERPEKSWDSNRLRKVKNKLIKLKHDFF